MLSYPEIFRVRQTFSRPLVEDIPAEVQSQLSALDLARKIRPGQSVAISVGSRGIANIAPIIRSAVEHLRGLDAEPLLVPAMGSHGGGTAEGQRQVIESYGVTEDFCGCPIRSGMETVVVCDAPEGFPVHFDRHAFEADHVLVCGRVKPHTHFKGNIESGLMKMMLIGLGKHEGAKVYHRAIQDYSFDQIVRSVAREVLARCGVVAGLAILENGYDETAKIAAVEPDEFEPREIKLLELAKSWMPKLPFDRADILLIDQMGKNISGTGLDTNIVGRTASEHAAGPDEFPKVKRIAVRGLTPQTHGNAAGIGTAEFCRTRLLRQMDVDVTRVNCITAGYPAAAIPALDYETDREILDQLLPIGGLALPPDAKLMWIPNTLHVVDVECSRIYLDQARDRDDLEVIVEPRPLPFDAKGNLPEGDAFWG